MSSDRCAKLRGLIASLDEAVEMTDVNQRCARVKQVLEDAFHSSDDLVPSECLRPCPEKYARHLLHRDPENRYSVIAMVWDKGQGTALHDHAGQWCVECVYRGRIKVVSYDVKQGDPHSDELVQFQREKEIFAGKGEAGALIPPFEYHTIENAEETPTVTIHVYGEELTWCHIFVPTEDGYRRERRELAYTS